MRLIDADALKKLIAANVYPVVDDFGDREYGMFWTGGIEKAIDEQPTIEERKTGRRETTRPDAPMFGYCPFCGRKRTSPQDNYCPNCGAHME